MISDFDRTLAYLDDAIEDAVTQLEHARADAIRLAMAGRLDSAVERVLENLESARRLTQRLETLSQPDGEASA